MYIHETYHYTHVRQWRKLGVEVCNQGETMQIEFLLWRKTYSVIIKTSKRRQARRKAK